MSDFLSHGERDYFVQEDEELEPQEEPKFQHLEEQQRQDDLASQQHKQEQEQQRDLELQQQQLQQDQVGLSDQDRYFERLKMMDSRHERPLCLGCLCSLCVC